MTKPHPIPQEKNMFICAWSRMRRGMKEETYCLPDETIIDITQ
jgi:hypothetical protein